MDTLRVLKIIAEGPVTSFRYPHFAQGMHPTFEMPPPATIYGHICSAVGWLISPSSVHFGYHFIFAAKFWDYEHLHFPGTKAGLNPFQRELLFQPRLTLYLDCLDESLDLLNAFRSPRYAVVLGRSQDLMTYTCVEEITLHLAERAYLENTLLPQEMAFYVDGNTLSVTLARYMDPRREPVWGRYAVLRGRAVYPPERGVRFEEAPRALWVDPEVADYPRRPELHRAVIFHGFVGE